MVTDVFALNGLAEYLDPVPNPYTNNPVLWVNERLGESLWSKQREIMDAVATHRRVAVRSCHDIGKSFSAARLICWWIDSHPPGEAFVVSTAPSGPQVEAILWREINRAAPKAKDPPLPGRLLIKEWRLGNELIGYGRKPSEYNASAFQGIHARFVLVVLDEACGIPESLWIAAGALVTNQDSRILAIGNPDDPTSHFARVCQPGSGWHSVQVSAFDSPNFTGEHVDPDIKVQLVSQEYLNDLEQDGCGEGTPVWTSKVLGEFPEDTEDSVVRPSAVAKCRLPEQVHDTDVPKELGVDVGAGGDMSVIMLRQGPVASLYERRKTPDTMVLVGMVMKAIEETGATRVKVDKTGIGQGVTDRLNELRNQGKHHAFISGVMVGSASSKPERFPRLRDQIWWEVGRMLSETRSWDLSRLDDITVTQLTAPRWAPDSAGRIQVEKKGETKKRLGRSPDDADALLLCFYAAADVTTEWLDSFQRRCVKCGEIQLPTAVKCHQCGNELPPPTTPLVDLVPVGFNVNGNGVELPKF